MLFLTSDESIDEMRDILENQKNKLSDFEYIECNQNEGKDALLHRYVAGAAPIRYKIIHSNEIGEILPLDVAFPRNFKGWD